MKPVKSGSELERMIYARLFRLDEVQEDMTADPRLDPKVSPPRWHERDSKGRNWNVASMNSAAVAYETWVGEIVDYLRWKYDIERSS